MSDSNSNASADSGSRNGDAASVAALNAIASQIITKVEGINGAVAQITEATHVAVGAIAAAQITATGEITTAQNNATKAVTGEKNAALEAIRAAQSDPFLAPHRRGYGDGYDR